MNEPYQDEHRPSLEIGMLLGQRRALTAVGGRCSAANAELLRRVRDEKLYATVAPSWRAFCSTYLCLSRRHADYLISLLNRFGPIYFELSDLIGISRRQYLAIEPTIRDGQIVVDGEAISFLPRNNPKIIEAVDQILKGSVHRKPRARTPDTLRARAVALAARGRDIANQLVDLYNSSRLSGDREFIADLATEIRVILMQPGND